MALAERLGARVITDLKLGAAFPTDHPLIAASPAPFSTSAAAAAIRDADLVLSLDWLDLAGAFKQAGGAPARVIQISLDYQLHNGWGMEYQALPPADIHLACDADVGAPCARRRASVDAGKLPEERSTAAGACGTARQAPLDLRRSPPRSARASPGERVTFVRLPLGWPGDARHFRHPLDFLGGDGGAGDRLGPGNAGRAPRSPCRAAGGWPSACSATAISS